MGRPFGSAICPPCVWLHNATSNGLSPTSSKPDGACISKADRAVRQHLDAGVLKVRNDGGCAGPVVMIAKDGESAERRVNPGQQVCETPGPPGIDADEVPAQ
jgi:hypothetical protein